VFYEMADPVERRGFVARAAPDPDADGHGAQARHVFRQDGEAVRKPGRLNLIYHHDC
jgi:hypothetical protein